MPRRPIPPGGHGPIAVTRQTDKRWRARTRYRDLAGRLREVEAVAKRKPDAEWTLERKLLTLRDPDALGVQPDWTMERLAQAWLRRRREDTRSPTGGTTTGRRPISPQTLAQYASTVRTQVVPRLGAHRLDHLTVAIVDNALVAEAASGRSVAHMRTVLTQMFGHAIRQGALRENPMRHVEAPVGREREVHALTVEEALALRALVRVEPSKPRPGPRPTQDLPDLVDLALVTGARIGELLALTWGDLALAPGKPAAVRIAATLVVPRKDPGADGTVYVKELTRQPTPKSRRSRTVLIPGPVAQRLRERRVASRHGADDDFVFPTRGGGPTWPNNVRTRLRRLTGGTEFSGVTPHTLRRTVGTLLEREHGVAVAGLVLGHVDGTVTARHYVADREMAPDVRATLARFLGEGTGEDDQSVRQLGT